MIGSLIGSFGFRTTFAISFQRLVSPPVGPERKIPLPTLVPIDRRFFEIDARIRMTSAATADDFDITIVGLSKDIFETLEPGKTLVTVSLGYSDGGTAPVMIGLLQERKLAPGDGFYEGHLKGVDYAFSRLRDPKKRVRKTFQNQTLGAMAKAICDDVGVPIQADAGPTRATQAFNDVTPLQALLSLARLGDFILRAKDGGIYMGAPSSIGSTDFAPIDDDGGGSKVAAKGAGADGQSLEVVDYTVAGRPRLRAGDTVTIGVDQYRLDSVTHDFKRAGSYVCSGRAISLSASKQDAAAAARPDAPATSAQLRSALEAREQRRPAVTAGEVKTYNDGHTADVKAGVSPTPDMVTPTTQAPLRGDPVTLSGKPLASPFAFDHCGLVTPVYPGMRALLVHGWHEPDDAVVDGFLWADGIAKPSNQPGDWWLCLPTQLDAGGRPIGNGVNDLTDAGGKRVINVRGLRITIGAALLQDVGTRPSLGEDGALTIESDQGPKVEISGTGVSLTDGVVTLKIANGKVSIG